MTWLFTTTLVSPFIFRPHPFVILKFSSLTQQPTAGSARDGRLSALLGTPRLVSKKRSPSICILRLIFTKAISWSGVAQSPQITHSLGCSLLVLSGTTTPWTMLLVLILPLPRSQMISRLKNYSAHCSNRGLIHKIMRTKRRRRV